MTTEEKLQHFYEASVQSAVQEAQRMKKEHQDALDRMYQEHKNTVERQAQARLQGESDKLKREINKAVSARQLEFRQAYSQKLDEIKTRLFGEVEEKLNQFRTTPAYQEYLCRKIREALAFAGEDPVTIYLDPSDEALIPVLSEKLGVLPVLSPQAFQGGMQAVIPSRNILMDNSFSSLLHEAREEFIFTGGITDE